MSYVFEGVVCRVPPTVQDTIKSQAAWGTCYETVAVGPEASAIVTSNVRTSGFTDEILGIARELSAELHKALVVRFDGRTGYRQASLYEAGRETNAFGEDSETYVLLDENGLPETNGRRYVRAEIEEDDSEREYESLENALQIGVRALGGCDWRDLLNAIESR